MSAVISVSVNAGPIFQASDGVVIMITGLYIHELTPEVAAQWIGVLKPIAEGEK